MSVLSAPLAGPLAGRVYGNGPGKRPTVVFFHGGGWVAGDLFTHERQARTLALRGSLDDSVTEHRAILAAIRLRDAEKAAELTAAHVRVPAQRLLESVGTRTETSKERAS